MAQRDSPERASRQSPRTVCVVGLLVAGKQYSPYPARTRSHHPRGTLEEPLGSVKGSRIECTRDEAKGERERKKNPTRFQQNDKL